MALEEYRAKRDFNITSEPPAKASPSHRQPIFVVQEHHASRLHYDFRLEADGVLKSWAVPKQPSMDPRHKRLAVQVEDHPLAYATFKGTIPEGQYGAGVVHIWDKGTYENLVSAQTLSEGIKAGRLEFALHGQKLKGRFALVRMRGKSGRKENWLLIKMKDEAARSEPQANGRHPKPAKRSRAKVRQSASPPAMADLVFTHPDKIMYPQAGITKGEILDYYRQIAPRLLPWLHDRPATLERFPNGIGNDGHAPHFWQKNLSASAPEWITRASLPTEQGETVHYALVNDLQTLLYFVNQGTLTFHVWLSPMPHLDQPDFVLFDLDPGPVGFAGAVVVAQALHAILQAAGRDAVVKTSGKAGLHMLVPWMKGDYDQARAWAEETADQLVHTMPDQATTERSKAKRGRRVYVDVMQNVKGHHVVPPYVLRPTPMATVSTPLTWKELKPTLDPRRFNLKTIFRRLARQRRDPMADLLSVVSGATQG